MLAPTATPPSSLSPWRPRLRRRNPWEIRWTTRRLSIRERPTHVDPERPVLLAGALCRQSALPFLEAEPLFAAAMTVSQLMATASAPWSALDVRAYAGFLFSDDCPGPGREVPRVITLVRQLDLVFDYLYLGGALDGARRDALVREAREVFEELVQMLV